MKKMLVAAMFAVLSLGTTSFAYDDGYGNDDSEYRSVQTVRNGSLPTSVDHLRSDRPRLIDFGVVAGVGFGGLRNVSGRFDYSDGTSPYDDWLAVGVNIGAFMKFNLLPMFSVAPEFSFTLRDFFRDIDHGYDFYRHVPYTAEENNYYFGMDIPLLLHFDVLPQFYIEAGPQVTFKFGENHTIDYKTDDGYDDDYYASLNVPGGWHFAPVRWALDFGLGGTFYAAGQRVEVGLRLVFDMNDMDKHHYTQKDYEWFEKGARYRNDARMWMVQFVARWYAF